MNSVATLFATQPVCNAARAAHALRSDQLWFPTMAKKLLFTDLSGRAKQGMMDQNVVFNI